MGDNEFFAISSNVVGEVSSVKPPAGGRIRSQGNYCLPPAGGRIRSPRLN